MSKKIEFGLSSKSVRQAMKELKAYKDSINQKCQIFVERLSEKGIAVARQNINAEYSNYITFSTELEPKRYGCKGLMVATQTGLVRRQWRTNNNATGIATADVAPLMMAEFGSGVKADNERGAQFGMGQGTFPGQTHAFDPGGWYWQDLDGNWHHSSGETPTMPMFHAHEEMFNSIAETAKEVFGS